MTKANMMWKMPDDKLWALQEAAKPGGFMPHAEGTKEFLIGLETEGLLKQSNVAPVWYVTDSGRSELERLA